MHDRPFHWPFIHRSYRANHLLSRRLSHRLSHRIASLLTPVLLVAMLVGCAAPANFDLPSIDLPSIDLPSIDSMDLNPSEISPENFAPANFMSRLLTVSNAMADEVSDGPNCLVTGEGTGFSSHGGGEGMPPDRVHGQFVWETMQKYLGQPVNGEMAPDLPDIENGVQAQLAAPTTVITAGNLPVAIFVVDEFTNPDLVISYTAPSQLYVVPGVGRDHYILMQAVDIEQFNLVEVTNDLRSAIASRKIPSIVSNEQPINLPPLQEFVFNMSWIVVPCSTLPEEADLTNYFGSICRATTFQEALNLSKLSDVINAVNRISAGGRSGDGDALTLAQLCIKLKAQDLLHTSMDLYGMNTLLEKTDIVSLFALRPYWLRGVYDELAERGLTSDLTRPVRNLGYQAINCFTNDMTFDEALDADLIASCLTLRSSLALAAIDQVIPVAAAGNDKRPFPYLPAAWDSVLSVGANNYASNSAEIWINGESAMADPIDLWKGGSSFAAPRVSVWAALYLATTRNARCGSTPTVRPVLGVKEDWNALTPSHKNLRLREAAHACLEFEDLVNTFAPIAP